MMRIYIVALFYLLHVTSGEDVLGGIVVKNPKDPKYKKLAKVSMKKYLNDAHIKDAYSIISVDNASEQVVNGLLTRIDFKITNKVKFVGVLKCHSKILAPSGGGPNEIKVRCRQYKTNGDKRVLGGIVVKNPKDHKYKKLAKDSMKKYLNDAQIKDAYRIISVDNASEQVVNGLLTRIDFKITNKVKFVGVLKCHSKILEPSGGGPNEIKVRCRQYKTNGDKRVLGGIVVKNPKDHKYKKLAKDSMKKYLNDAQIKDAYRIISVDNASEQVVNGLLTRIDFKITNKVKFVGVLKCHSKILEPSGGGPNEINVHCRQYKQKSNFNKHKNSNLNKPNGNGVPGGIEVMNPEDPKYYKLAKDSMKKYLNDAHIKEKYYRVIAVENATEQMVNGLITRIDFKITNAYRNSPSEGILQCHSKILEPSGGGPNEIKVHCRKYKPKQTNKHKNLKFVQSQNKSNGNGVPGGIEVMNPKDPKYKKLAEDSMKKYLDDAHITDAYRIISVDNASEQMVNGLITRIDFQITNTVKIVGILKCHSKILEPSGGGPNEIKVRCRQRNGGGAVPGGLINQDPKDPKYKKLAEESMEKYLNDMQTKVPHKVSYIERVTTQVVSGEMTRIDFAIQPNVTNWSGIPQKCHSEIWEQPWQNVKDIKVRCMVLRSFYDNNNHELRI